MGKEERGGRREEGGRRREEGGRRREEGGERVRQRKRVGETISHKSILVHTAEMTWHKICLQHCHVQY